MVWKSFETEAAPPPLRSERCFEQQEEVRLEVGLDAVALGRNIDHGIGEREDEKGRARRRGQVGCLRALSSSSASLSTKAQGERRDEKGSARGRRNQPKRYNGPTTAAYTRRIYRVIVKRRSVFPGVALVYLLGYIFLLTT